MSQEGRPCTSLWCHGTTVGGDGLNFAQGDQSVCGRNIFWRILPAPLNSSLGTHQSLGRKRHSCVVDASGPSTMCGGDSTDDRSHETRHGK